MEEIKLTALEQERYDIVRSCIGGDITNKESSVEKIVLKKPLNTKNKNTNTQLA